ncbi:MAG: aminotransferase class III-fold pyridoxal phosphate-dependent enzyme [Candidatus Wallbacteria bacterium]|nr:aminotransferase class III-fold pyridoxal phosphate-dependent enzyme [Candidatus Wallbacteria bacterium]MBI4866902.1 aminotransferase class III-fold pyridoxal phosphate-dependent enzyme [Candidatus Wallbacteria bacterium]
MTRKEIIKESRHWLDLISARKITRYQRRKIVRETIGNFDSYYNKGFLEYRKSMTEAGEFAAVEWTGRGSYFTDILGRRYLDCLGGYGIYSAGIRHPTVIKAVQHQLERMPLSSQELLDPLRGALGELLGEIAPGDLQKCFFISNGTDAVEGAMKLARLYTKKSGFISCLRGFHGKSYGSLSLMGKSEYRVDFEPLLQDVYFVPFGDATAVAMELEKAAAVGLDIAGVVVEPIQGEAGAIVPPDDYWPRLREICTRFNVLLIADEVQTGMGRTGKLFGVEHWDVVPDIMCLGKALGGGVMPLSAFISTPEIWGVLEGNPFIHSSTFGGNPLACAAGIAAIYVTFAEDLPGRAAKSGEYLMEKLREIQARHSDVLVEVRGKGLLIGLEFVTSEFGYSVAAGLFRRGVLVAGTLLNAKTLRVEPALNISKKEMNELLEKLDDTLDDLS